MPNISHHNQKPKYNRADRRLDPLTINIIDFALRIMQEQDLGLHNHSKMVSAVARQVAIKLKLSSSAVDALSQAAYIHDIGKLLLPYGIMQRAERLTDDEWKIVKQHPLLSHKVTHKFITNKIILSAVVGHHERVDGSGYPYGNRPNVYAQILGVSDIFIALQEPRVYRPSLSRKSSVKAVTEQAFDKEVIDAFLEACKCRR